MARMLYRPHREWHQRRRGNVRSGVPMKPSSVRKVLFAGIAALGLSSCAGVSDQQASVAADVASAPQPVAPQSAALQSAAPQAAAPTQSLGPLLSNARQ